MHYANLVEEVDVYEDENYGSYLSVELLTDPDFHV